MKIEFNPILNATISQQEIKKIPVKSVLKTASLLTASLSLLALVAKADIVETNKQTVASSSQNAKAGMIALDKLMKDKNSDGKYFTFNDMVSGVAEKEQKKVIYSVSVQDLAKHIRKNPDFYSNFCGYKKIILNKLADYTLSKLPKDYKFDNSVLKNCGYFETLSPDSDEAGFIASGFTPEAVEDIKMDKDLHSKLAANVSNVIKKDKFVWIDEYAAMLLLLPETESKKD